MIGYPFSMQVNGNICGSIYQFYFLSNVVVWYTIIVPVTVKLNMAVFHNLDLKIFLQFPIIMWKRMEMLFFFSFKKHISTLFSPLKWLIIMRFKPFENGIVKIIKVS